MTDIIESSRSSLTRVAISVSSGTTHTIDVNAGEEGDIINITLLAASPAAVLYVTSGESSDALQPTGPTGPGAGNGGIGVPLMTDTAQAKTYRLKVGSKRNQVKIFNPVGGTTVPFIFVRLDTLSRGMGGNV